MREERIENEFKLLQEAAGSAPNRISAVTRAREGFHFRLHETPAFKTQPDGSGSELGASGQGHWGDQMRSTHGVRISFPRYFPAMPMEAFVDEPVFHPNAHPDTGFLCIWSTHRVAHTMLNSIARVAAVLTWQLQNDEVEHVMQPHALRWFESLDAADRARLPLPLEPLPFPYTSLPPNPEQWRRRLS